MPRRVFLSRAQTIRANDFGLVLPAANFLMKPKLL
jgi:hypothetical protein